MLRQLRKTIAVLLCGVCALSTIAYAADDARVYFSGYKGLNLAAEAPKTLNDTLQAKSRSFGGVLGFRLYDSVRLEAQFTEKSYDSSSDTNEVRAASFLLNGYYDFDLDLPVYPYIGAGAGFASFQTPGFTSSQPRTDTGFVYQLTGGLKYPVEDDLMITGSYNYRGTADIDLEQTDFDYSAHELKIGVEYKLPILWEE